MRHGVRHQGLNADITGGCPLDVVKALNDDKHVINTYTETEEGEDGVDQGVGVIENRGDTNAHDEPKHDADDPGKGQEDPVLDAPQGPEHDAGVGQHQEVAGCHEETIKEDRVS